MFDMGFYPDLRKLIKVVPPADRRQTMLFSATLNNWVKNLAWEYTKSPVEIEITPEKVTVEEIDQVLYHVPSGDKMKLLLGIFEREKPESAIVFCNTKRYTEIVAKRLRANGIECEFIMGDLPQVKRQKTIDDFKAGKVRFLVATDVAARGLDIEDLAMVVNYDLPEEIEGYVHRIGRTARAGKTGKAITLCSEQDVYELVPIERYINKKIPPVTATPDLYAEDKSEGMRIHADDYGDDRRGRRDRDSGDRNRRDSGRGRGDRGHAERRGFAGEGRTGESRRPRENQGEAARPARSANAASGGSRRGDRNQGERRTSDNRRRTDGGGAAGDNQSLTAMSLDERMAYYRKKYGGGEKGANRAQTGEKRADRDMKTDRETAGGGQRDGRRQRRGGGGRGPGQGAQAVPANEAARPLPQGERSAKPVEAAPKKAGLFSRVLGIFRKST
jgi:ATP-dependent RNA helicase RhlB